MLSLLLGEKVGLRARVKTNMRPHVSDFAGNSTCQLFHLNRFGSGEGDPPPTGPVTVNGPDDPAAFRNRRFSSAWRDSMA